MEPREIGNCGTLTDTQICDMRSLGDYDCNTSIEKSDAIAFVLKYIDGHITKPEAIEKIFAYIDFQNNVNNFANIRTNELEQIATSQVTTQDSTQVTRQQALNQLSSANINTNDILAIINVQKNDGYDIFFKGPEVLEYLVTFGDNVDSTSTIKTQENKDIFHNLFTTTDPEYSEQAFRIDGTKVYQARRSNTDTLTTTPSLSTTPWSTNLIHMFTSTYRITSLTKIQFSNGQVYEDAAAKDKYEIISPS